MKIKVPKEKKIWTPIDEKIPKVEDGERGEWRKADGNVGTVCPYCSSAEVVKRGTRKKKHERVQLFICRNKDCGRSFTAEESKGRRYPIKIVIEGLNYYNLGFTLEQTCRILKQKFKIEPDSQTLAKWVAQYEPLCRYCRLRPYALKMYRPVDTIECVSLAHRQLYNFRYHRAKMKLMLEEFRNRNLRPLKDFLDIVGSETPHQSFLEGERMSEIRSKFDKTQTIIRSKKNFANKLAEFALKGARNNKERHQAIQRFMIANDSVTVATEVPVIIRREDVEHMQKVLGFEIVGEEGISFRKRAAREEKKQFRQRGEGRNGPKGKAMSAPEGLPRILTGHIDLVQVRNGQVHILDYKPNAAKERPIEQLTWYALALSRLTGLRVFEFKCAWFDEKDYFEFFPLHIVKKLKTKMMGKKRFAKLRDGLKVSIPLSDILKVV